MIELDQIKPINITQARYLYPFTDHILAATAKVVKVALACQRHQPRTRGSKARASHIENFKLIN